MNANFYPPGRYVLTQEVRIPRPDLRCKYDWRVLQTVPAGMMFLVEERNEGAWSASRTIRPEGNYSDKIYFSSLATHDDEDYRGYGDLLRAMIPYLVPAPWDIHSTLDFRFNKGWYSPVLDKLAEMGKITLNDVVEACNALDRE